MATRSKVATYRDLGVMEAASPSVREVILDRLEQGIRVLGVCVDPVEHALLFVAKAACKDCFGRQREQDT